MQTCVCLRAHRAVDAAEAVRWVEWLLQVVSAEMILGAPLRGCGTACVNGVEVLAHAAGRAVGGQKKSAGNDELFKEHAAAIGNLQHMSRGLRVEEWEQCLMMDSDAEPSSPIFTSCTSAPVIKRAHGAPEQHASTTSAMLSAWSPPLQLACASGAESKRARISDSSDG